MWMDPKDDDVDNNRGFGTRQTHWLLDIYKLQYLQTPARKDESA